MRGRRLWMKLDTHAGPVPVYVRPINGVKGDDGEILHAQYVYGTPSYIEVEWNENAVTMMKNVFHELVHNCYEGSGSTLWERMLGTTEEDVAEKREEENAIFLEDKLFDVLLRNKLLKWPKPPKVGA